MNIFGSSWTVPYDNETMENNANLQLDPKNTYNEEPYFIGIDPIWQLLQAPLLDRAGVPSPDHILGASLRVHGVYDVLQVGRLQRQERRFVAVSSKRRYSIVLGSFPDHILGASLRVHGVCVLQDGSPTAPRTKFLQASLLDRARVPSPDHILGASLRVHGVYDVLQAKVCGSFFKRRYSIVLEFLPQIIFLVLLFAYMVFMMFFKWVAYSAKNEGNQLHQAPLLDRAGVPSPDHILGTPLRVHGVHDVLQVGRIQRQERRLRIHAGLRAVRPDPLHQHDAVLKPGAPRRVQGVHVRGPGVSAEGFRAGGSVLHSCNAAGQTAVPSVRGEEGG
ncbi:hypothetical protein NE865_09828 [Phthorimaea operculella]|nr:hypothetical protein NE865_09828 [Phthorimaea operculella]